MKQKSEEDDLIEAAQMRAFYVSLGVSEEITEAAIKIRHNRPPPYPQKGRPKGKRRVARPGFRATNAC
jgi:hypothetical protein